MYTYIYSSPRRSGRTPTGERCPRCPMSMSFDQGTKAVLIDMITALAPSLWMASCRSLASIIASPVPETTATGMPVARMSLDKVQPHRSTPQSVHRPQRGDQATIGGLAQGLVHQNRHARMDIGPSTSYGWRCSPENGTTCLR